MRARAATSSTSCCAAGGALARSRRGRDGYGDPREAVGPEKVRRLRRAAEIWLARNPDLLELEVAFEVVGVRGKRIERVPL
jgi:Holliday junction resolvase-like predicted endonuclease